jgi:cysteine-rich repeat protein
VTGSGETCDDGNLVTGDGCDSTCSIETGWECPTSGPST